MFYPGAEDDYDLLLHACRLKRSESVSGRRHIMFHGTTRKAAKSILKYGFLQSLNGMLGLGVYLSRDPDKASRYPIDHPEHDKVIIIVFVDVGRVIAINYQGHPRQKTWHNFRYGKVYDTAWVPPNCGMVESGLEEVCVWDPNRIKIIKVIYPRADQQRGRIGLATVLNPQQELCPTPGDGAEVGVGVAVGIGIVLGILFVLLRL